MPAPTKPLTMLPLEMETTSVMAMKERAKYSHGPILTAMAAMSGQAIMAMMMEGAVPRKLDRVPMDSAREASPRLVMA